MKRRNRNRIVRTVVVAASLVLGLWVAPAVQALDGDTVQPWERSADTHRNNLENSIRYLEQMDTSAYTEDSVNALAKAVAKAKEVAAGDGKTAKVYWTERTELEYARSMLIAKSIVSEERKSIVPFRELSKEELIDEMGTGINLGNTMDGHSAMTPGELVWQNVVTTKEVIRSMHDAGYNTLRIPVTWGNMITKDEETGKYSINERWLTRVQEIVDYAVSQNMYAIINIHHDGVNWDDGWFNIGCNDIDAVMEKYAALWQIVAERFADYDEHLIFESMNEITCSVTEKAMWDGNGQNYDRDIIRNFNQLFVNTVRAAGGNNRKRWLASVGHFASSAKIELPEDPCNEGLSHQIFAAHIYNSISNLLSELDKMNQNYNCAMYLGEWSTYLGKDGRTDSKYNDISVAYDSQRVNRACRKNGICPIVWNCGMYTNDDGSLQTGGSQYWNRADKKPVFDSIIDAVMRGSYLDPDELTVESQYDDSRTHMKNTNIESIQCADSLSMTSGAVQKLEVQVSPKGTNDVLVWSTSDDSVATVTHGIVTAGKPGTAVLTAYAQNSVDYGYYRHYTADPFAGAVKKEITLTVVPDEDSGVTKMNVPASLTVEEGKSESLNLSLEGAASARVYYSSADEKIATVNSVGRVFGQALGQTVITAVTASGKTVEIPVTVKEMVRDRHINVALFLYFNDTKHNYYNNECGKPLKITKEGTYTVSFDVNEDMSDAARSAGLNTINRVGSIYVKDYDVYKGDILDSNAVSAKVAWEEIKINGEPVSIKSEFLNPFEAMQNGILDTANPVNTWSGSVFEGVTLAGEHEAVFDVENPQRIDVTFKISDIEWKSPEPAVENTPVPTSPTAESSGQQTGGGVPPLTPYPLATAAANGQTTVPAKKPAQVKGVKLFRTPGKLKVKWKNVKGAAYQIAYSTVKRKVSNLKNTVKVKSVSLKTAKKNAVTLKRLKKGKRYYVRVRAYRKNGGRILYGKWSKTASKRV